MFLRFIPASDASLLVVVGDEISQPCSARAIALFHALRRARAPFVLDLHPAYTSVLVEFDPIRATHGRIERLVARVVDSGAPPPAGRVVEVPVRYDGPDLDETAAMCGLTRAEVIERHSAGRYLVAFLGFLPGFAYLLGLDAALAVPRLATPRAHVPAGSVAIGGGQAAIYPCASPGGWRLLGHTDLAMPPGWVEPGDALRFVQSGLSR